MYSLTHLEKAWSPLMCESGVSEAVGLLFSTMVSMPSAAEPA